MVARKKLKLISETRLKGGDLFRGFPILEENKIRLFVSISSSKIEIFNSKIESYIKRIIL